ncbi:SUMF1/EgtB/PvdO family nonheme iron enzyme [bacterium]|nr:SUMF1/EgtB/PvdO family nonheme iron enzyme [bacterium]
MKNSAISEKDKFKFAYCFVFLGAWLFLSELPAIATKICPACKAFYEDTVNYCPADGKSLKVAGENEKAKIEIKILPKSGKLKMDGRSLGNSSDLTTDLSPGKHLLEAEAPEFVPQKLFFTISSNQFLSLTLELIPVSQVLRSESITATGSFVQVNYLATQTGSAPPQRISHHPLDFEMVEVKAGNYALGSDRGNPDERPIRHVVTPGFWIDKYEVTCEQYKHFLDSISMYGHQWCHPGEPSFKDHTPYHTYAWALRFSWIGKVPPPEMGRCPVVLVE